MAFPTLDSISTPSTGSGTSHSVNYPSSGIDAGDILICIFATDGDNSVTNWGGFTQIGAVDDGKDIFLAAAYKVASGSESGTFTVTTSSSEDSSHYVLCFSGAGTPDGTINATGDSEYPDPPSHTPGGGSGDYVVIAIASNDGNGVTTSEWPYADNNYSNSSGGPGGTNVSLCTDELNGSSFNPGTFTISSGDEWCAGTICVPPVSGETVQIANATIALVGEPLVVNAAEDITITKAAVALVGEPLVVNMEEAITITKGAIALVAKTLNVNIKETITVTKGAIALVGEPLTVLAAEIVQITKAAISAVGQAITVNIKEIVAITKAAVALVGKTLYINEVFLIAKAAITAAGQALVVNAAEIVQITKGAIALVGQAVTVIISTTILVGKATISLLGKALGVNEGAAALKRMKTWLYYRFWGR